MISNPQYSDGSESATPSTASSGSPSLALSATTIDHYCHSVCRARNNEFWWYYNGLVRPPFRKQKPFQDSTGRWWWMVKPLFVWPVDCFNPIPGGFKVKPRPILLGWQYPTSESAANSIIRQNVIHDLSGYGIERVEANKRRAIRRAIRELRYEVMRPDLPSVAEEARVVWNSHVHRTGWNRAMEAGEFSRSWAELAAMPGTTVIGARDPGNSNLLCAWLIVRLLHDVIYIDTLASHSDRVKDRPNDGLIFLAVSAAAQMGMGHAHYSLVSRIESLEAFKRSLGFVAHPFPCKLHLRRPMTAILRQFRPQLYLRLCGDEGWHTNPKS